MFKLFHRIRHHARGTGTMIDFKEQKMQLLDRLERSGYINKIVREAMERLPREDFVPDDVKVSAYEDRPLSIGLGQTISAPHMYGMYSTSLEFQQGKTTKILEIGTGSGYQAALCAEMLRLSGAKGHVYTIERIAELAKRAKDVIKKLGYEDLVTIITGDGTLGYAEEAPYDRILVTAAAPRIPEALLGQLGEGGLMLIPVGEMHGCQTLYKITKTEGTIKQTEISGVAFVPLVGKDGFSV
nr:protein-L-isoaspartate(D-aspartate) O-methyltransferase [Candidatus Sigynarchaeota archaeon]